MILTIEPLSGVTIKKVLGSKPPKKTLAVTPKPISPTKNKYSGSSGSDSEKDEDDEKPSPDQKEKDLAEKKTPRRRTKKTMGSRRSTTW